MLWEFFLITLKVGTFAYGGAYAMIAPLHYDLVTRLGWLTETQFSSSVAVGQITPGPLMVMVGSMGYKIAGVPGATRGTIGLFPPTALIDLPRLSKVLVSCTARIVVRMFSVLLPHAPLPPN